MSETYQTVNLNEISIASCKCYQYYRRNILKKNNEETVFDRSTERFKSFRKYFEEEKKLFHFCINCFNELVLNILIEILKFEVNQRERGECILQNTLGLMEDEDVCKSCINFIIRNFSGNCFIKI